jgi:hypothetical protein
MQIRYSPHAVDRMVERNISTVDVERVLRKPDGVIRHSMDKIIAYKQVRGRKDNVLAVVAVERNEEFEVVTVLANFEVRK